jgi:hypothetical protein
MEHFETLDVSRELMKEILEPSLIAKCSICSWVFGTNFEFMKLSGCSSFEHFVALCHAVPLTRSSLFTYNLLFTINIRAR